jgi:hypothetical protein
LQAELAKTKKKLSSAKNKSKQRNQELDSLRSQLAQKQRAFDSRGEALDDARSNVADLHSTLRQRNEELDLQRARLSGAIAEFERSLGASNAAHDTEIANLRQALAHAELQRSEEGPADDWLTRGPAVDALEVAFKLHRQLVQNGYAKWERFEYNSFIPEDKRIWLCEMDGNDFKVPLFSSFMYWSKDPKSCMVCANDYHELDIISPNHWMKACHGFEGSWIKDIFSFPFREDLTCNHDMDVCKNCITAQIGTQLETHGSQGWAKLSCPQCNRHLNHDEIRKFASKDDFAKYERYYLLEHLSKEPGFRWCLSNSCTSGQLYEEFKYMNPHISCSDCAFEMCFKHQVPWHAGLSCIQYDKRMAHGEDEEKTEVWKKQHTKACPGANCAKPLVKGEGCFHMTCYQCNHEFCWECLADWGSVRAQKSNHKEGCYFRTATVGPMGINGATLEVALRRV